MHIIGRKFMEWWRFMKNPSVWTWMFTILFDKSNFFISRLPKYLANVWLKFGFNKFPLQRMFWRNQNQFYNKMEHHILSPLLFLVRFYQCQEDRKVKHPEQYWPQRSIDVWHRMRFIQNLFDYSLKGTSDIVIQNREP